jgi:SCP-2 sterol transfer family
MTEWLSDEWFDRARQVWADGPGLGGLAGRVQCEITGGPDGGVSCYWVLEEGRLAAATGGRLDDADVTLTLGWDDAVAVQRGELDPNVAFMQGRMKVSGSMGVTIDLLAAADSPACRALRERMAEISRS